MIEFDEYDISSYSYPASPQQEENEQITALFAANAALQLVLRTCIFNDQEDAKDVIYAKQLIQKAVHNYIIKN